jgi:ATP-dependent Clp protease ATP-binding subunit ClpB
MLAGVNAAIAKLPKVQGGAQPGMSAALQKVMEQAFKEAENFKDEYVSTEHLLLALTRSEERSGAGGAGGDGRDA